ncbi:FtsX-like permease family protein [Paenibacillus lautus]|uniref:FtsX-like permease family protein n=1 Tax=Paenibacillus lautus TaxID=1401 RepID=UPI002DBE718D|nr:FtsX-like permease family protein [Paenibacillus lautus]MEC0203690.1 FtsX-like permease family protein [Paenibacillus lautus]
MKKRALWTDIFREISRTKARFLSIFAIIMLGVGFFAGIKATGPDMLDTADHYYSDLKLMDLKVQSTLGLEQSDIEKLKQVAGVDVVQPGYSADVFLGDSGRIAKILSYDPGNNLNQYVLTEGRMPEAVGEIVIDAGDRGNEFKLGDQITFTNPDHGVNLKKTFDHLTYTVVGRAKSPLFISSMSRGTSGIGKGTADVFAVIPEEVFKLPVYTEAYLTFQDTAESIPYTADYDEKISRYKEALELALETMPQERLAEIRADGQKKLDEAVDKIEDAKKQLADAEQELMEAKIKLNEGEQSYRDGVNKLQTELAQGQAKLDSSAKKLAQGRAELKRNQQQLEQGQSQLKTGQSQLDQQKSELAPKLAQGQQLAKALQQISGLDPESIPEGQRQELLSAAQAADPKLGAATAGFMEGALDGAALQQAASAFRSGLNEASLQLDNAQQKLDASQAELKEGQAKLREAERQLVQGEASLKQGTEELATARQAGEAKLADAKAELSQGREEYQEGLKKFNEEKVKAKREIADGEKEVAEGQKELDQLELPKVYVMDRSANPGYTEYSDNADRLSSIATAFPVFFFLIAALVSLTTMTRMVEEQRLQIGTLKALGYGNRDVMKKFLVYSTLASVAASAAGLAIGFTLFPAIIYDAYGALYNLPDVRTRFYLSYSIISIVVAVLCTTMTAYVATRVELRSNASVLMRPRAPKNGSRIWLERVPWVWNRLGFIGKVTARNLFRYKQRMFMTVCGVAGCTALILTGFGLKDSIGDIAPLQYGKIMQHQATVVFQDDNGDSGMLEDYNKRIADTPEITGIMNVTQEAMTAAAPGVNAQDVSLFVPQSPKEIDSFIVLKSREQEQKLSLTDDGAIITEKLAKLFDLEIGSTFTVQNSDNEPFEIRVAGITENYAMHYVYMTPVYYEEIFDAAPEVNSQLLTYDHNGHDPEWEDRLGESLTASERVAMVSFTSGVSDAFSDTMDSMNVVVVVLIISAAALAFVVLYNLTNINVSERIRELSTIKVLGFYDKEVTMYIYRENMILTVLGIIAGSLGGVFLHRFVLLTAEVDAMMFSPTIHGISYGYAALLTLLFSAIVMASMHYKLKRIDMIEALKSVE